MKVDPVTIVQDRGDRAQPISQYALGERSQLVAITSNR